MALSCIISEIKR